VSTLDPYLYCCKTELRTCSCDVLLDPRSDIRKWNEYRYDLQHIHRIPNLFMNLFSKYPIQPFSKISERYNTSIYRCSPRFRFPCLEVVSAKERSLQLASTDQKAPCCLLIPNMTMRVEVSCKNACTCTLAIGEEKSSNVTGVSFNMV
jgi:hypothetical protein